MSTIESGVEYEAMAAEELVAQVVDVSAKGTV
jgi:hypothetical protein